MDHGPMDGARNSLQKFKDFMNLLGVWLYQSPQEKYLIHINIT